MEAGDVILSVGVWIVIEVEKDGYYCWSFDMASDKRTLAKKLHISQRFLEPAIIFRRAKDSVKYRHEAVSSIFVADGVTTAWSG